MAGLTLRTKFIGAFTALSFMIAALTWTSLQAISSLNAGRMSRDAGQTDQLAESLSEISGGQQILVLHSLLGDAAGAGAEQRIDALAGRGLTRDLQARIAGIRLIREQIVRLLQLERRDAALKLVREQLLPACEELQRKARDLLTARREAVRSDAAATRLFTFTFAALTATCWLLTGLVAGQMNHALGGIRNQVSEGARQVTLAAGQMGSLSQSIAKGAAEQAVSLDRASASAEQMRRRARRNTRNSREAAEHGNEVNRLLTETNERMTRMFDAMCDISSSSRQTSKIICMLDEIAFQTNILSLSAAVEAARAGQAGRGFAVVGGEMRNLARLCSQAAKDTAALIEKSLQHSKSGKIRLDELAAAIHRVTDNALRMQRVSNEVSAGSEEQSCGLEQISNAMLEIRERMQETAANADEVSLAGAQTSAEAEHLESAVSRMRAMLGASAGLSGRKT